MGLMRIVTKHVTEVNNTPRLYKADFLFCCTTDFYIDDTDMKLWH